MTICKKCGRDGILSKIEYRMKWYGEDEKTARRGLALARDGQTDDGLMGFGDG